MIDDSVQTFTNFFRGFKTFAQLKQKLPGFVPLRTHEQNPHNYEPIGLKAREEMKEKKAKEALNPNANQPINKRLAEQLKRRQNEADNSNLIA